MTGASIATLLVYSFSLAFRALVFSSSVWLPVVLVYLSFWLWTYYARARWIRDLPFVLLEIKLPKEVAKTPQAMEVVLMALHIPVDPPNFLKKYFEGEMRLPSSLELTSFGGDIHFYIRVPASTKNRVESAIYSQYPNAEVREVEDYTQNVPYGLAGSNWKLSATELQFIRPDAYPIKTYIDYGTDQLVKDEETKVDPISATIEFLGTLKPEEQIWIQILLVATRKRFKKKKNWAEIWYQPSEWFEKNDWQDDAKDVIKKIREADSPKPKPGEAQRFSFPTPGQTDILKAIERTLGKPAFDCGIRMIYLTPEGAGGAGTFGSMISSFAQYNSAGPGNQVGHNGFRPYNITSIKYPWQDLTGRKLAIKKAKMFDAYRRRSYFYPPYVRKQMVLTTEEVATIFHFPGKIVSTPSLAKIESKRAEPPVNLPM